MGNEHSQLLEALAELGQRSEIKPSVRSRHGWDPIDKSDNIILENHNLVARLGGTSNSAGAVKGRKRYCKGSHFFEFGWRPGDNKSVCIGIGTVKANITPKDDSSLIVGADDQSIGWDLVSGKVYFNDCIIKTLTEGTDDGMRLPDTVIMNLNMNDGTLSFSSKDKQYGVAMSGIKHIADDFCIFASVGTKGDHISVKYLGNSDDMVESIKDEALRFHRECGKNIEIENYGKTARRKNHQGCFQYATVITNRPLNVDEELTIRLDKKDSRTWHGGIMFGATSTEPMELDLPADISRCTQGENWIYNESRIGYQTRVVERGLINLDNLNEGDKVALKRTADHIEFFVNGARQAKIRLSTSAPIYGLVDLYGQCIQVSLTDSTKGTTSTSKRSVRLPRNKDEFLEKLTLTIKLLDRKSVQFMKETLVAVQVNLDQVYHHFKDKNLRREAADRICEMGGAKVIYDYLLFLQQRGIAEKSLEDELLQNLLSVIVNYCDNSLSLCSSFGECGMLEWLIGLLKDTTTTSYCQMTLKKEAFGILHNCAKATENKPIYRRLDFVSVAQPFANCDKYRLYFVMQVVMTMSYVCEENHAELLTLSPDLLEYIVCVLTQATQSTDGAFHQHNGWHAYEIAVGMTNLTISNKNSKLFVKHGAITALAQMLGFEASNDVECALNAIWSLADFGIDRDTCHDLASAIATLKDNADENLAAGAVRLEIKLQSLGVLGSKDKELSSGDSCSYRDLCQKFGRSLQIHDVYFDENFNRCYCARCHGKRKSKGYKSKGDPPKSYGVPVGWYRMGLRVPPQAQGNKAFDKWHRAYHGTKKEAIGKILDVGGLVPPGRNVLGNERVDIRSGHFNENLKPDNFDVYQVFLSPSMRYSGIDAYAKPSMFTDKSTGELYKVKVAFQVLISPESYQVGPQTVGARSQIDPGFNNQELEWSTNQHGATILYGLLLKLDEID